MPAYHREAFTSLVIYRGVEEGATHFLDHVREAGEQIFGYEVHSVTPEVCIDESDESGDSTIMSIRGIPTPRLDLYKQRDLRLYLLDKYAPTRLNFSSKFRWAASKVINAADYIPHKRTKRSEGEEAQRHGGSLARRFYQIGLQYDILDQKHLELNFNAVTQPVELIHDYLGQEVTLLPDATDRAFMMLLDQAKLCVRGLGMHSAKVGYPECRRALQLPFARMPLDATPEQRADFIKAVEERLPVRFILGDFEDDVHASA